MVGDVYRRYETADCLTHQFFYYVQIVFLTDYFLLVLNVVVRFMTLTFFFSAPFPFDSFKRLVFDESGFPNLWKKPDAFHN